MADVLGIVAPVFLLIVMGAVALRLRFLSAEAIKGMTDLVFYTAMPCLLFRSVVEAPPLRLADVAVAFIGGAYVLYALGLFAARKLLRLRLAQASVFGINCVFGNTVMLGIPIVDAAFGAEGVANLLAVVALHSAMLLPVATIVIEADTGTGSGPLAVLRAAVPGIVRNPVIVAIGAALVWRLTGWGLAGPVQRFLVLAGSAGPPLALFCLGASLPAPRGLRDLREIALAAIFKLVLMPALVAWIAHLMGVRGVAFAVVVLAAGMPTGANAFLLARRFGTMLEASASTVVVCTAASVVTLSFLLEWLR